MLHDPKRALLYQRMRDASAYLTARRDPGKGVVHRVTTALGVGVGAAGTGYLIGRTGHWNVPGTPLPWGLTLGVGLHALDVFGLVGGYGEHVANLANGAIASWATMMGAGYGQDARSKSGAPMGPPSPAIVAGQAPVASFAAPRTAQRRAPLTEAELVAMARRHR
jgi:hypothetical protein